MTVKTKKIGLVTLCGAMSLGSLNGCLSQKNSTEERKDISTFEIYQSGEVLNKPLRIDKEYFEKIMKKYSNSQENQK